MCEKVSSVTCRRSVVSSGYSSFLHQKTDSSSFHRLDMTLAVAEALNPNKPKSWIYIYLELVSGLYISLSLQELLFYWRRDEKSPSHVLKN